jgi:site-specific DNA-cytosine methylase
MNPRYRFKVVFNPDDDFLTRGLVSAPKAPVPAAPPPYIPPRPNETIKFAEHFGGYGHASMAMPNAWAPVAYFDNDSTAAAAYSDHNPDVPMWGDIADITRNPADFVRSACTADVAFIGAPCNDHSLINDSRKECSNNSRKVLDAVNLLKKSGNSIGVLECVPNFMSVNGGVLFSNLCDALNGYTMYPMLFDARQMGGGTNPKTALSVPRQRRRG